MGKLEGLIQGFCPNGVAFPVLNMICNIFDETHQTPKYTENGIKYLIDNNYDECVIGLPDNLSVLSYVEQEDTREKIDIVKLNAEIKEIVARAENLWAEINKIIAEIEVEA